MRTKIQTTHFPNFISINKVFAAEETLQRNNKLMCMTATTQGIQCLLYKLLST